MSSTMDKLKDKLHIRRKSQSEPDSLMQHYGNEEHGEARHSIDSELEAMTPAEREAYLKEWDETEKTDTAKKNGLIEKLIARGNKRTEDQLAQEMKEAEAQRAARAGGGVPAGAGGGAGVAPGAGLGGSTAAHDHVVR